jgi:hypothetical protein
VSIPIAASRDGNAASPMRPVTSVVQANTGIRIIVMPGARLVRMVHTNVPLRMIMPQAARNTPTIHRFMPGPGE